MQVLLLLLFQLLVPLGASKLSFYLKNDAGAYFRGGSVSALRSLGLNDDDVWCAEVLLAKDHIMASRINGKPVVQLDTVAPKDDTICGSIDALKAILDHLQGSVILGLKLNMDNEGRMHRPVSILLDPDVADQVEYCMLEVLNIHVVSTQVHIHLLEAKDRGQWDLAVTLSEGKTEKATNLSVSSLHALLTFFHAHPNFRPDACCLVRKGAATGLSNRATPHITLDFPYERALALLAWPALRAAQAVPLWGVPSDLKASLIQAILLEPHEDAERVSAKVVLAKGTSGSDTDYLRVLLCGLIQYENFRAGRFHSRTNAVFPYSLRFGGLGSKPIQLTTGHSAVQIHEACKARRDFSQLDMGKAPVLIEVESNKPIGNGPIVVLIVGAPSNATHRKALFVHLLTEFMHQANDLLRARLYHIYLSNSDDGKETHFRSTIMLADVPQEDYKSITNKFLSIMTNACLASGWRKIAIDCYRPNSLAYRPDSKVHLVLEFVDVEASLFTPTLKLHNVRTTGNTALQAPGCTKTALDKDAVWCDYDVLPEESRMWHLLKKPVSPSTSAFPFDSLESILCPVLLCNDQPPKAPDASVEPAVSLSPREEPETLVSLAKEPEVLVSLDEEPKAPVSLTKEPEAPIPLAKEPEAPVSLDEEPAAAEFPVVEFPVTATTVTLIAGSRVCRLESFDSLHSLVSSGEPFKLVLGQNLALDGQVVCQCLVGPDIASIGTLVREVLARSCNVIRLDFKGPGTCSIVIDPESLALRQLASVRQWLSPFATVVQVGLRPCGDL